MYKVLFTVREKYYDEIAAGTKTVEVRRATERWLTVSGKVTAHNKAGEKVKAMFMCGRRPIIERSILDTRYYTSAEKALGRQPSDQGRMDLGDDAVITFELGEWN